MLLKRELGPKSWVMERVVDAIFKRRGSGSLGAASWLQFHAKIRANWASNQPPKRPRLTTISATIGL